MLSLQQVQAISMLMEDRTHQSIAEEIGIAKSTLSRWLNHDPLFQRELAKARRQFLNAAINAHVKHVAEALETLRQLGNVATPGVMNKDKISAADKYISHVVDLMDTTQAQESLERLEQCDNADQSASDTPKNGEAEDGSSPSCL